MGSDAESNGDITGIGAKLPVQPTSSSSSPSASECLHGRFSANCRFRAEAVRPCPKAEPGELDAARACLQPQPAILSTFNLCHANDPGHASKPASLIEPSLLSFLYASASVPNDLPCSITFLSSNYSMHPAPPSLSPPSTAPTLKTAFGGAVNEISSWGRTIHHDLVFAPDSASASLASGSIVPHRLSTTFSTVAPLGLSTTPKTRSRSLASGSQFTLRLIGIPLAVWTLEKAPPGYLCLRRLVLDRLTLRANQRQHSSSTTTPSSRSVSTILLLSAPLNSANRVPPSVNLAPTQSTPPPPFNKVSPRAHPAYGSFRTPAAPTRLRRPAQRLEWAFRRHNSNPSTTASPLQSKTRTKTPLALYHPSAMTGGREKDTRGREFVFVRLYEYRADGRCRKLAVVVSSEHSGLSEKSKPRVEGGLRSERREEAHDMAAPFSECLWTVGGTDGRGVLEGWRVAVLRRLAEWYTCCKRASCGALVESEISAGECISARLPEVRLGSRQSSIPGQAKGKERRTSLLWDWAGEDWRWTQPSERKHIVQKADISVFAPELHARETIPGLGIVQQAGWISKLLSWDRPWDAWRIEVLRCLHLEDGSSSTGYHEACVYSQSGIVLLRVRLEGK
ncbi:hypothetical protein DFP72DRAFT_1048266 [Ephemerocybe angulata]|uniref:Uncharacterized protein n=1 Tax=Ephemerocybe angulata TaxID=980116 RepID=A0A8H6HNW2_9AGAR|nr:hypothetical protein DFP72DRAFT_1048266 [Tulosesus angulatus]